MECAVHVGVETSDACPSCKRAMCIACASYEVDERSTCEACGTKAEARSRSLGTGLLFLIGTGYLTVIALGVALFHARAFVGGLAIVAAIVIARSFAVVVKPAVVRRRQRAT